MATRKKKAAPKTRKRQLMERAGLAVLKGSGSAAMGASVAVVEETVSERAGAGARAAMAAAGLATEIFVDPAKNPIIAEAGKAGLHTASGVTAYKVTKAKTKQWKIDKAEREKKEMVAKLREELATPVEETEETEEPHVVPKATTKPKTKPEA